MVTVNLMNLVFYCNSRELCQQKGFQLFKKKIITYCNTSSSDRKGIPVYIFKKIELTILYLILVILFSSVTGFPMATIVTLINYD